MNERADLEIEEIKRCLADLNDRLHALEAKAPENLAVVITPTISIVGDINQRVHSLEAKVTRLQMFSLDRPGGASPKTS